MTDISDFKIALEQEHIALLEQLEKLGVQNPDNKNDWVTAQTTQPQEADPNDVADRVEAYDTARATLAQLETRYNNVTNALKKISANTYGVCEIGGEQISIDRLRANPAARTCSTHMETDI